MNISDFIRELEKMKEGEGDLPIRWASGTNLWTPILRVKEMTTKGVSGKQKVVIINS